MPTSTCPQFALGYIPLRQGGNGRKRVENPDLIEELGSRVHNKLNHGASILSLTHLLHLGLISISTNSGSIPRYRARVAGQFLWGPSWFFLMSRVGPGSTDIRLKTFQKKGIN